MIHAYSVRDDKRKRIIIDTDAGCEADDPFAIAQALLTPQFIVKAVCAEHYAAITEAGCSELHASSDSMEHSYRIAKKVVNLSGLDVPVFRGQPRALNNVDPLNDEDLSPAARAIIDEALSDDPHPLFLLCLGAISNVAAALLACPQIAHRMTIIWIGTQTIDPQETAGREFNASNDVVAANIVLESGATVWLVPSQVYRTMGVGLAELCVKLEGTGPLGEFLLANMLGYNASDLAFWTAGESWALGDSPAVGIAMRPECGEFHYAPAPLIAADSTSVFRPDRPLVRIYDSIDSRFVLEDFFAKMRLNAITGTDGPTVAR